MIVAPCAVRGIESAGGKLVAVVTEFGTIRTGRAVLAGGAWSSAFLRNIGRRLPIANLFSWCASFGGGAGSPEVSGLFQDTTWRRQIDGRYTTSLLSLNAPVTPDTFRYLPQFVAALRSGMPIRPRIGRYTLEEFFSAGSWKLDEVSPFERRRILAPVVDHMVTDRALERMKNNVAAFKAPAQASLWGGVISASPDFKPVLGPVDGIAGLTIATGFPDGLLIAPAIGTLVAEIVQGRQPSCDISQFGMNRFA
jgi:glycine/D-amino acid oxidase-like deaminating enzyme